MHVTAPVAEAAWAFKYLLSTATLLFRLTLFINPLPNTVYGPALVTPVAPGIMASQFIGYEALVTLKAPANGKLKGQITDVVGQNLMLQNGMGSILEPEDLYSRHNHDWH